MAAGIGYGAWASWQDELTGRAAILLRDSGRRPAPRYIAVEGPIGVGKTTLAKRLASALDYPLLLEPALENPFLERFYRQPARYALPTQLFFLLHRARQLADLSEDDLLDPLLVADFLMDKDRLFAKLTLDAQEFRLYEQISASLGPRPPQPDLVIYLQAPVKVLLERIRQRGAAFEQCIRASYLEALAKAYASFFQDYDRSPLFIVNAAEIDFASNPAHFDALLQAMQGMRGARQHFNPNPGLI